MSQDSTTSSKATDSHALDRLTGGAFTAPTSGERAARIRDWLASQPGTEQLQDVFRELSARDKGAAKAVREKLDELKRARGQEVLAAEWARKAQALLDLPRLNMADALAWQRDAAKAGAPLSKEPLATHKLALGERVKGIEDLQTRVQVQREAAVLLAQRIEVLSTKALSVAQAALDVLRADVLHWQEQAAALASDANWASVDVRFPNWLDASKAQLQVVWDAFQGALAQAVAAAADPAAPLPPVPVWADELRAARGVAVEPTPKPAKPRVDPELRAQANQAVADALARLEREVGEGHGKASAGAAQALRAALKEHGKLVGDKIEAQAHAALAAAGELEGWQRWRADQLRQELVAKAEGLLQRTGKDGQPLPEGEGPRPTLGGRKMQETLRNLREQWKQTDQGGSSNHGLWKRFDDACNEAHKVVEAWLDKIKAEAAEHRAQRLALIEEVKAWGVAHAQPQDADWKAFSRALHQFGDRWREAGHLSEKAFAEMQPLWRDAIHGAAAPLEAAQAQSVQRRQAMIEEAQALGAAPVLRIDAVKALQQRWQAEAQSVPLDRKFEQRQWDAFRKPIDDAFQRKTSEREKAAGALSERDRAVLDAAKAVDAATAAGDVQKIRAAVAALEAATRGQAAAAAAAAAANAGPHGAPAAAGAGAAMGAGAAAPVPAAAAHVSDSAPPLATSAEEPPAEGTTEPPTATGPVAEPAAEAAAPAAVPVRKPVVAVRGDDRPGMRKAEPMAGGRPGRRDERGPRRDGPGGPGGARPGSRFGERGGERSFDRAAADDRGPRLGDAAFRAQRDAMEQAQQTLRKLAAQAHGEALAQLLGAWEQRDAGQLPSAQELGSRVSPSVRSAWAQALAAAPQGEPGDALLRLEIAAEAPTPAEHLSARRLMQLQLLTRRNEAAPAETWGQDTARVLASGAEPQAARRLQNALKNLLRR